MGSLKHDRWYLYTMNHPQSEPDVPDHTLEVMMSDIPQEVLKLYSMAECKSGEECTKVGMIIAYVIIYKRIFKNFYSFHSNYSKRCCIITICI